MLPRLAIAREMLRSDGVIFISIDDNESAHLKLLCDEIFGEENFVAQVIWERAYSPVNLKKHFSESHDFVLCYAKDIEKLVCNGLPRSDEANDRYQNPDDDPRGPWKSSDFSVGPAVEANIYEIVTPSGRVCLPPSGYSWRFSRERFEELRADNRVWFGADGGNVPALKRFLSEVKQSVTPMTIWKYQDVGHSQSAAKDLKELMGGVNVFTYPKPLGLIDRCLQLYTSPNDGDIVMDFFAGSGTTAHAVLAANARDGGNRRFICAQLGEELDEKKSRAACEFLRSLGREQNIYEITRERILRAAAALGVGARLAEYELIAKPQSTAAEEFVLDDGLFASFKAPCELLESFMLADGRALDTPVRWVDLAGYSAAVVGERMYLLREGFGYEQIAALAECEQISGLRAVVAYEGALSSAMHKSLKDHIHVQNNAQSYENAPLKNCEYEVRFL